MGKDSLFVHVVHFCHYSRVRQFLAPEQLLVHVFDQRAPSLPDNLDDLKLNRCELHSKWPVSGSARILRTLGFGHLVETARWAVSRTIFHRAGDAPAGRSTLG